MINRTNGSPRKEARKNYTDWTSVRSKAELDENRVSPDFPTTSDTCSTSGLTSPAQYDGESVDFGDAGADLI